MNQEEIITKTSEYVRATLGQESSGHDWWHIKRVWTLAKQICREEGADTFVVQLAALLHDISDYKLNGGDIDLGPKTARAWLEKLGVDSDSINHVCEIMTDMSFKGAGVKCGMRTGEGMIVQDADRLDAIGAIGVGRAFAYGGFKGASMYEPDEEPVLHPSFEAYRARTSSTIQHFYEKLLLLKDRMNTESAKRIAQERNEFMEQFLKQFLSEWEGNDSQPLALANHESGQKSGHK